MGANESQPISDAENVDADTTTAATLSSTPAVAPPQADLPSSTVSTPILRAPPPTPTPVGGGGESSYQPQQQFLHHHQPFSHPHPPPSALFPSSSFTSSQQQHLEAQLTTARLQLNEVRRSTLNRRHIPEEKQLWNTYTDKIDVTEDEGGEGRKVKVKVEKEKGKGRKADRAIKQENGARGNSSSNNTAASATGATTFTAQPQAPASASSIPNAAASSSSSSRPKMTPSEATLAYLIWSVQANSSQQHVDVLAKQVELLKERIDEYKREREKEQMVQQQQQQQTDTRMHSVDNDIDPDDKTSTPNEIDIHFPDTKKPRRQSPSHVTAASSAALLSPPLLPIPIALPPPAAAVSSLPAQYVESSPFSSNNDLPLPDYSHSQFQEMRDTNTEEEESTAAATLYPDLFEHEQQQQYSSGVPLNYSNDEISAGGDADMLSVPDPIHSLAATPTPSFSSPGTFNTTNTNTTSAFDSSPLLATPSQVSKGLLEACLSDKVLEYLETSYREGKISYDTVRYELTMIHHALEPEHERELVEKFRGVKIEDGDGRSGSGGGGVMDMIDSVQNNSLVTTSSSSSVVQHALATLPEYKDTYSPDEAVDDDADGVARLRVHVMMSDSTMQQQNVHLTGKRKNLTRDGRDGTIATDPSPSKIPSSSATSALSPSSLPPTSTSSSSSIYRLMYCNRAFERLFGFTQSDIKSYGVSGINKLDLTLRKDHWRNAHHIQQRWWREGITDAIMYQVRSRADGVCIYCLVHMKLSFIHGRLHQALASLMPLPIDEQGGQLQMPPVCS